MKRLHIVGKSKDNKRLYLAQKKGAKFGSFDIPIGPKLLRLIGEVQDARAERTKPARGASDGDAPGVRAVPGPAEAAPPPAPETPAAGGGARQLRIAGDDLDIPINPDERAARGSPAAAPEAVPEPPRPAAEPEPQAETPPAEAAAPERPARPEPARRTSRPEIPARSKLSPAEIQALIRAGRGVRSVANLAGTPVAWVKYLAEPIQQERLGIVRQMLGARQERTRLGPSSAPIGESILQNLRGRGVRNPEGVLEQSFTAHRPDGREWRIRLVFDHRGNRYSASWSWDPQTREVTPLNTMAVQLGWRRQPGQDDEEPRPRPRTATRKSSRSKRSGRTTSTRKKTSSRKKSSARKKTSTRRSSSGRR